MLSEAYASLFDFSGYIEIPRKIIRNHNGQQFAVQKYQGKHSREYTVMELENGIAHGTAQLFKNGILQMSWKMNHGKREGTFTLYKNGVVDRISSLDEYYQTGEDLSEQRIIETINHVSGKQKPLLKIVRDAVVVYIGEYNAYSKRREGYGIEFDEKTGRPLMCGYFKEDRLVHISKEFLEEEDGRKVMIEYGGKRSENNVDEILDRIPIFTGEYTYDSITGDFVRHGRGYVINEKTGVCDSVSEWRYGEVVNEQHRILSGGWYGGYFYDKFIRQNAMEEEKKKRLEKLEKLQQEEERKRVEDEKKKEEEEENRYWNEQLEVCPDLQIERSRGLETFVTGNNTMNGKIGYSNKMKLTLTGFPRLKQIEIGDSCFKFVRKFLLEKLESLVTVKIGKNCFTISNEERNDGICRITECPKLRELSILYNSFYDYESFQLGEVNSLQSIQFYGFCFWYADFSLKGE